MAQTNAPSPPPPTNLLFYSQLMEVFLLQKWQCGAAAGANGALWDRADAHSHLKKNMSGPRLTFLHPNTKSQEQQPARI